MMTATIVRTPIFSSDQASERVRGISVLSRIRITTEMSANTGPSSARSSSALPSNTRLPSFSMMNSASSALCSSADTIRTTPFSRTAVCVAT